ncbi:methyltransferase domain-containing protein [Paraburkholderia flagellata]|uniref:methyltransferase domain-containing protein n=1 Tax=Paraburkholderia flagellata TaxID=2883241 RepID=UPI001F3A5B7F|nr:methyltransferase domain-containing protein [Paraburkholderia flagellata]
MHPSAMDNGRRFFDAYVKRMGNVRVAEIGSQNVNGSLRDVCPAEAEYIGLDFVAGNGVDLVLSDPYHFPLDSGSVDIVVSSSCFEHSSMFWLSFNEVLRLLKPNGLFFLNAPSNGLFHRYPVDSWRFYPDAGSSLVEWAKRCGVNAALLESYTAYQKGDVWNDFVAVFLKNEVHIGDHPARILDTLTEFTNGLLHGRDTFLNPEEQPQDLSDKLTAQQELKALRAENEALKEELLAVSCRATRGNPSAK